MEPNAAPPFATGPLTVAVVGLGNIGSQVVDLLVGLGLRAVHLVDPDRYEPRNVGQQRVCPRDVGKRKAEVQAAYLRGLGAGFEVIVWVRHFQAVPMGHWRHAVILSCVDSRGARQAISHAAVVLGIPWVDAAIDASGLVRVRWFWPGGPCLECGWSQDEYALLEQRHPCQARPAAPAPTNASPEIGATAAAIQVSMLRSLLSGVDPRGAAADQWCLSPPHRHAFAARFEVNPHCRHDHRPWDVTSLAADAETLALGQALALAGDDRGNAPAAALSVDGQAFVRRTRCLRCGYLSRSRLRLSARAPTRACPACGAPLQVTGADVLDGLAVARVPKAWLDRCLGALGLEDRDLFTVTDGNGVAHHFELAAPDATA